jgi:hypothetical protein
MLTSSLLLHWLIGKIFLVKDKNFFAYSRRSSVNNNDMWFIWCHIIEWNSEDLMKFNLIIFIEGMWHMCGMLMIKSACIAIFRLLVKRRNSLLKDCYVKRRVKHTTLGHLCQKSCTAHYYGFYMSKVVQSTPLWVSSVKRCSMCTTGVKNRVQHTTQTTPTQQQLPKKPCGI